jgi:hypothetical protein
MGRTPPRVYRNDVLLVCLYAFVSGQLGRIYGLIAMLVILCLPVRAYAVQARPYGVLLGLTGLALIFYHRAAAGRGKSLTGRRLALMALVGCTASLTATHYYAVLVVAVLLVASLVSAWERRSLDWPLTACCVGPPVVVLVILRDIIRQQRLQLTHYFARGSLISFDHGYDDLQMDPLVCCIALLLMIATCAVYIRSGDVRPSAALLKNKSLDAVYLAIGLLSLPLVGAIVTQFITHAYLTRYFVAASVGFAICICFGTKLFAGFIPGLPVLLLIPLGLGFGKAILQEVHRAPAAVPSIDAFSGETTPILFDTPEAYMQVYHYLPAIRNASWVIADPPAALRYRQYDTDDRIMLALAAQGRAQAITLSAAARKWPAFRLVPRTADYVWALKCVMDAGAEVRVSQAFSASNFVFAVNVLPKHIALIEACAR